MFITSLVNIRLDRKWSSRAMRVGWHLGSGGRVYVLLPGILARGDEQFETLIPTLSTRGCVDVRSYTGHSFNMERVASSVARDVDAYARQGLQVTIIGASLGGLVGYESLSKLNVGCCSNVKLIMVDTPHGVETMRALPSPAAFVFRVFRGAPLPNFIGDRVLSMMRVGPKKEFVDTPQGVDGNSHYELVNQKALAGLSGHRFSTWWSQLVSMVAHRPQQPVCEAFDITYVACLGAGNDVVAQPMSVRLWQETRPNLRVIEMEGAHCGFLQQSPRWISLFTETLV